MAKKNDSVILALKKEIEQKKSSLKSTERFSPLTNLSLVIDGARYNLNVQSPDMLVLLLVRLQSWKLAAESLNIDNVMVEGYKLDDWLTDLNAKYMIANKQKETARLKVLEDKLHQLLSVDKKVELELADIAKMIEG